MGFPTSVQAAQLQRQLHCNAQNQATGVEVFNGHIALVTIDWQKARKDLGVICAVPVRLTLPLSELNDGLLSLGRKFSIHAYLASKLAFSVCASACAANGCSTKRPGHVFDRRAISLVPAVFVVAANWWVHADELLHVQRFQGIFHACPGHGCVVRAVPSRYPWGKRQIQICSRRFCLRGSSVKGDG